MNDSLAIDDKTFQTHALILAIIPIMTVFGNGLVVLAVYREKSLQSVTNYLIVSLAVSDFLVAICVMSFAVYFEYNNFVWGLGATLCNVYIGFDVVCSTASILNLLAISLDRYIAISHPLAYAQYGTKNGRALITIVLVWSVSLAVGMPIFMGANQLDEAKEACEFTNGHFIIVSSLLSFFLPCLAMIALYTVVFRRLKQRERARSMRHYHQHLTKPENDRISAALLSGARIARQMGKHFKDKTDQILLEISFQTSSFPTMSYSNSESMCSGDLKSSIQIDGVITSAVVEEASCISQKESISSSFVESIKTNNKNINLMRSFGEDLEEELFPFIDESISCTNSNIDTVSNKKLTKELTNIKYQSYSMTPLNNLTFTYFDNNNITSYNTTNIIRNNPLSSSQSLPFNTTSNGYSNRKENEIEKNNNDNSIHSSHYSLCKIVKSNILTKKHFIPFPNDKILNANNKLSLNASCIKKEESWHDSIRDYKDEFFKKITGFRTRPSRQLVKKATKQMKREHKATVTLAIVLAVFLGCWLPFFALHTSNAICMLNHADRCIHIFATLFTTWLGYLNSSLNPLIYTVFDQRFRKAFRNILNCIK